MVEATDTNPYSTPTSAVAAPVSNPLYSAAIGIQNTGFYLRYLECGSRASWNWPAFLVSSYWLLYRKLWAGFFLYFVISLACVLVPIPLLGLEIGAAAGQVAAFAFQFIVFPMYANAWYARKLRHLVAKAQELNSDQSMQIAWLAGKGGTSYVWVVLLLLPLIGIVLAVALPAYQEYATRAVGG